MTISAAEARAIWLRAQRLDTPAPFGDGPEATPAAVRHLGYVQIDTINVIERAHHHILFTRIPHYKREHLHQAQTIDKAVFEYWTHALAYVPSEDFRFFLPDMKRHRANPSRWFGNIDAADYRRVLKLIRDEGPQTIRDFEGETLVEKVHPWASRKPSKAALQFGFYTGDLVISARNGMLKTYELTARHFGWEAVPRPATERQIAEYLLRRGLRSQGIVSAESVCYLNAKAKPQVKEAIERGVNRRELVPVAITGEEKAQLWAERESLAVRPEAADLVHILSPFDPLVIQRKRTKLFFGYEHLFEAYLPREKRVMGYFTLPVLVGDQIVAALDLKTDRQNGTLLIQRWTWVGDGSPESHKTRIEEALGRFERFQLEPQTETAP